MTRKSPKSFLHAKSCVESVSEVFFEVPARPDELGTLLLAHDSRNHVDAKSKKRTAAAPAPAPAPAPAAKNKKRTAAVAAPAPAAKKLRKR